jgi:predicted Zn-dependent peptidase
VELARLKESKRLIIQNEFDKITNAGASSLNAGTRRPHVYLNVLQCFELWFDGIRPPAQSRFPRIYSSARRFSKSVECARTAPRLGNLKRFNALFWTSSPYAWPVVGWPSDLDGLTRQEALDYFAVNYAPNNITACLVGDFDTERARQLADRYFGRLKRNPQSQAPVRTREVEQIESG